MSETKMVKPSTCILLNEYEMECDGAGKAGDIALIVLGSLILTAGVTLSITMGVSLYRMGCLDADGRAATIMPIIPCLAGLAPLLGGIDGLKGEK